MSVEATSAVLSLYVGDSTRKLVLIGLANHAHRDGRAAYAGIETLAAYANCSARTVQRHFAKLVVDGFIREGDRSVIDA
ncbi:helix-turn-helix domain-containing protein [Kineococcus sp. GCM10028916]|uniref:helix-turn-helix domain-containing protein n=1 Tax=Kineococcus sp. GCM10028916 TaxID=3273394 RepID=UPI00363E36F3